MSIRHRIAVATLSLLVASTAFAAKVGELAPEIARADIAGKQLKLSDYRGKLVLLNFWATWCPPCREEMPKFSQWQRDWQSKGLQVIGISMDDDATSVKDFLSAHPVTYRIAMGDVKLAETYGGVLGLPLSYLIDAHGRVVARYQGETDLVKMESKVRELLGGR